MIDGIIYEQNPKGAVDKCRIHMSTCVYSWVEGLVLDGSVEGEESVAINCEWPEKITEILDHSGQRFSTYDPHNIGVPLFGPQWVW